MAGIYLIHSDASLGQVLRSALQGRSDFTLKGHALSASEAVNKLPTGVQIVIVQLRLPDNDGFAVVQNLQLKHPYLVFVPVLQGNEAGDVWQKILQLGMRDVLVPPFNPQAIVDILVKAAQNISTTHDSQGTTSSYVIAVVGARSGVGKTLFATSLAYSMSRQGAQISLLDYSMCPGDFFTMLDQVPRNTLADAIAQGISLDSELLKNLFAQHKNGFEFLACPNDDFDFWGFTDEQAKHLINEARKFSEFIIIDTGAYDIQPTNAAVVEADLVYMIVTRDLTRLMAAQRWMKALVARGVSAEKFKVIINNAEVGTELSEGEIEEILSYPITAYLPSCPEEAAYSINSGKAFLEVRKEHPYAAVLNKLAEFSIQRWA